MKVVILCGGKGTRLKESTDYMPKPMVSVGDKPILWHIMKYYSCFGHNDFVLCLGYKSDVIKNYFRNYLWNTCDVTVSLSAPASPMFHGRTNEENWTITLAETGDESLTGSRIRKIRRYIPEGERFLLTYGDGLSTLDINASIENHIQRGKICTVSAVHPAGRYGVIRISEDDSIHFFREKPQAESDYVNGGFMVCDYRIFDYLPEDRNIAFETEPIAALVRDKQLNSFRHEGFWYSMDNFKEQQYLNSLWTSGNAPWKIW